MKGKRYNTEEKVRILRDVDAGRSIVDICREKNFSDVTYHRWRKQFGHLNLNEAKRLKGLERENTELKKMLADSMRAKEVLEYALEKNCEPGAQEAGRGSGRQRRCVLRAGWLSDPRAVALRVLVSGR
ncbi:MAG: transposase [Verrucomicrobia bacterium]|nr:transposase [Verrucomicrobiota bacterium]